MGQSGNRAGALLPRLVEDEELPVPVEEPACYLKHPYPMCPDRPRSWWHVGQSGGVTALIGAPICRRTSASWLRRTSSCRDAIRLSKLRTWSSSI